MNRSTYWLTLTAGVLAALYIYGFAFDTLSENELVQLSYLWFLAIIFGVSGLTAGRFQEQLKTEPQKPLRTVLVPALKSYGIFGAAGQLLLFPLILFNLRSVFLLALLSSLCWGLLLLLFFELIFPAL